MPTSNQDNKKKRLTNGALMRYATMGTTMLSVMVAFSFGGHLLDQWLHLKIPILTIVLSIAGVFIAIYMVIRDLLKK